MSSAYGAGLLEPGDWLVKLGGAGDILVVSDGAARRRPPLSGRPPRGGVAAQRVHGHQRQPRPLAGARERRRAAGHARRRGPGHPARRGRDRLPAVLPGREVPPARPGAARRVRGPAPGPRARAPASRGAGGGRLRLSPSRGGVRRARGRARARAGDQRRQPLDAVEADPGRRARRPSSPRCSTIPEPRSAPPWPPESAPAASAAGTRSRRWSRSGTRSSPVPSFAQRYDELYAIYRELEPALRPISHRLAAEEWS